MKPYIYTSKEGERVCKRAKEELIKALNSLLKTVKDLNYVQV